MVGRILISYNPTCSQLPMNLQRRLQGSTAAEVSGLRTTPAKLQRVLPDKPLTYQDGLFGLMIPIINPIKCLFEGF